MKSRKMTVAEITLTALVWAEESMEQMIDGCGSDSEHGKKVAAELKLLRDYRLRRFGKRGVAQ